MYICSNINQKKYAYEKDFTIYSLNSFVIDD